jgi:hypothetical protein
VKPLPTNRLQQLQAAADIFHVHSQRVLLVGCRENLANGKASQQTVIVRLPFRYISIVWYIDTIPVTVGCTAGYMVSNLCIPSVVQLSPLHLLLRVPIIHSLT